MLYNGNVTEQKQTVYGQEDVHKMNQGQLLGECENVQLETLTTYQKKEIRVVLEFPTQSDINAKKEFEDRLKEIYLRKVELGSIQSGKSALESSPTEKSATKEEKNHE